MLAASTADRVVTTVVLGFVIVGVIFAVSALVGSGQLRCWHAQWQYRTGDATFIEAVKSVAPTASLHAVGADLRHSEATWR
jgi:hypothetical protein